MIAELHLSTLGDNTILLKAENEAETSKLDKLICLDEKDSIYFNSSTGYYEVNIDYNLKEMSEKDA